MFRAAVLLRSVAFLVSFAVADASRWKGIEFTKVFGCNFDTSLCGFVQDINDDFNWTRHMGDTSSSSTGPSADHTTGNGSYMYIETSSPRQQGDKAILNSPQLQFSGSMCLKFYYHMYGSSIGTLNVIINGNNVFTASGDKGNKWLSVAINLNLSGKQAVTFEGIRGSSYHGDIAVDDFVLELGSCYAIFGCNFDTSMCGFVQDSDDDFNWSRHMGDTSSSSTGPSADHTTGNGYYMYVETSSPRQQGDIAKLKSPSLPFLGSMCLKFYYHMYGSGIGTLKVNSSGMHTYLYTASGDKGNKWLMATIDVNFTGMYTVTFEGMRGTDFQGDIAIDDFVLEPGSCFSNGLDCSPTEIINLSATLRSRMGIGFYLGYGGITGELRRRRMAKRSLSIGLDRIFLDCDFDGNGLLEMGEFVWCLHWLFRGFSGFLELGTNCLSGFIKSCDNDGNLEISEQEWPACFEIEGKWSRWSPWTDCSRTCRKGEQSRSRTCSGKLTGKALNSGRCAGKPQQGKSCADWKCPDGKKSCPAYKKGTLEGRVFSFGDAPLAGANISLAESPYLILNRSQDNGYFVVDAFCFEKEKPILITRHGYVPQTVDVPNSRSVLNVKMENAVHPIVKIHPEDRRRFAGQDVTFCCQAEGNPPPVIEWFRNGNILDQDAFNYNESLMLRKVAKNMAGEFRCRAVNEFGAGFSEPAVLEVLDPVVDTCNSALSDHFVALPDGCSEDGTGNNRINIRKCKPQPCLSAGTLLPAQSCDEAERCCQVGVLSEITVRCGQGEFSMERVLNCICNVCNEKTTIVKGIVVGRLHERPVQYCDILVNGTVVSYSDYDGTFKIPVPKSAKRLVATFRDYMEEYEESTVVLPFQKGTTTFHKIHLRLAVAAIEFDAKEGKVVPIANGDVAQVIIPANSLIDKDGNPKRGKAKVKVQFYDPRNERDILESPGEFSTIDEDGEEQLLETYGVFKIKVQDENNQNLALTKNLQININLEQLTRETFDKSEPFPHLWWLDEKTGRWVDAGELKRNENSPQRRKRQRPPQQNTFSANIEPDNLLRPLNLDKPEQMCFAKVRAEANGEGIEGAKVTVILKNRRTQATQSVRNSVTDSDGYACIRTQCNSQGYLEVQKKELRFFPQEERLPTTVDCSIVDLGQKGPITIKFNPGAWAYKGPVYRREERSSCMSNSEGHTVFSFYSKHKNPKVFKTEFKAVGKKNKETYNRKKNFERCFLRVVTFGTKKVLIKAESYFAKDEKTRLLYGVTETEPVKNKNNLFVACLEHWCPENDDVLVHLQTLLGKCRRSHVPHLLNKNKNQGLKEYEARALIPHRDQLSGNYLGIWTWSKLGKREFKEVMDECVKYENKGASEGSAVKFNCEN